MLGEKEREYLREHYGNHDYRYDIPTNWLRELLLEERPQNYQELKERLEDLEDMLAVVRSLQRRLP